VDAVCEVPYGAYPGTMPYEYDYDEAHLQQWLTVEKDDKAFKDFLDYYIYNCKDHEEYLLKNGGMKKIQALRRKELYLETEVVDDCL
jgi:glutaconate CoA-transferase subunit A